MSMDRYLRIAQQRIAEERAVQDPAQPAPAIISDEERIHAYRDYSKYAALSLAPIIRELNQLAPDDKPFRLEPIGGDSNRASFDLWRGDTALTLSVAGTGDGRELEIYMSGPNGTGEKRATLPFVMGEEAHAQPRLAYEIVRSGLWGANEEHSQDSLKRMIAEAKERGRQYMAELAAQGIRPIFSEEARMIVQPVVDDINRVLPPHPWGLLTLRKEGHLTLARENMPNEGLVLQIALEDRDRKGRKSRIAAVTLTSEGMGGFDQKLYVARIKTPKEKAKFRTRLEASVRKYNI